MQSGGLSQLETGLADVTRRARSHRDRLAGGAGPHGDRDRRAGGARAAAGRARERARAAAGRAECRRAPLRSRPASTRASWRCRSSRGAPRMPRSRRRSRVSTSSSRTCCSAATNCCASSLPTRRRSRRSRPSSSARFRPAPQVEAELHAARVASEELDAVLREHESERASIAERVEAARAALDDARLAAQQVRVRRESIAEQLAATSFELPALLAGPRRRRRPRSTGRRICTETNGKNRAPGPGEPRRHRRVQGAVRAQGIPRPAVQGPHRRARDARVGDAQDRPRDPRRASRKPSTR